MQNKIVRWIDGIINGMAVIAGLLLMFMMFSICYEVVLRYFLFSPLTWVTEISEYILLYATFLGAPWVLKKDAHVKVDIVIARLGFKARKIVNLVTSLISIAVCLVLVWFGTQMSVDLFQRGIPVIKSLSVPKFLLVGIIPLGGVFLAIQFIRRIYESSLDLKNSTVTKS
jgi:TRAP-type C4-dicarboxylate transport system permease small subunit